MKIIKPMLAYSVGKKEINWDELVFIQPKLDGVRCIFTKDGAYSRAGNTFKNLEHIEKYLKGFFYAYPDAILDGELYNHALKKDFEKIISLVRKTKPTDHDRELAKKLVQFHCYDVVGIYGNFNEVVASNAPFEDRDEFIKNNWNNKTRYVKTVPTNICWSDNYVGIFHKAFLEQGYEGSILRLNGPYEFKRSYNLQKVKDFSDSEALIVGYELGKGKREGTLGKFIMEDEEGIRFGCPPGKGYNYLAMTEMLNNIHRYIGRRATFTYFGRTKKNSYRHPLFKALRNYE